MNEQQNLPSSTNQTPATQPTTPKPRERGLEGIDVRPVLHRLDGMVGRPWTDVSAKIDALNAMRRAETRSAYLRCVGENVATSEEVLPDAPFYVDANGILARRERVPSDTADNLVVLSEEIEKFLDGRVIGIRGETYFWFDPIPSKKKTFARTCPTTGRPLYNRDSQTVFRQGRALSKDETAAFKEFDERCRAAIIAKAPAFSPPPAN